MPRIRAIAESYATSNPTRRTAKVNPRHPASKIYTASDGGSVRLTWSPVNQTWFLLWPGDSPVEKQQVLNRYETWEEGDREARRITSRDAPSSLAVSRVRDNPADADYVLMYAGGAVSQPYKLLDMAIDEAKALSRPGSYGGEVNVVERNGYSTRTVGTARLGKYQAENPRGRKLNKLTWSQWAVETRKLAADRGINFGDIYAVGGDHDSELWATYFRQGLTPAEAVEKMSRPYETENPRLQQKTIVLAWTEEGTEAYGPEARVDLGQRRASRPVKVAYAALWRASGDRTDIAKAQAYADKSNANAESIKYYVFAYPTNDRDWKEHAKRDVLKAAG